MSQDIKLWFNKANLSIKIEGNPISGGSALNVKDVFQFSIHTKNKEYFRMYKGAEDNLIQVLDIDKNNRQVLFQVKELEREYQVYNQREDRYISQKTPNDLRKYLAGMDESHLFISRLPNNLGIINKVKDAHRILKPNNINKKKSTSKRQGEWFFIPVTTEEDSLIEHSKILIRKKYILRSSGKPHIAEHGVKIKDKIFVKGKIKHIDHKTLVLHNWYRVELNQEVRDSNRRYISGIVGWID